MIADGVPRVVGRIVVAQVNARRLIVRDRPQQGLKIKIKRRRHCPKFLAVGDASGAAKGSKITWSNVPRTNCTAAGQGIAAATDRSECIACAAPRACVRAASNFQAPLP
jgi:hypothetical protein